MKYKVYDSLVRTFEKDGESKEMKSLVLQGEGAQYPTKNVALWSDHPDYEKAKTGETFEWELKETESKTQNPHGGFYKNRSVMNPNETGETVNNPSLEERVQKLENAVYKDKSFTEEEINPDNIPF